MPVAIVQPPVLALLLAPLLNRREALLDQVGVGVKLALDAGAHGPQHAGGTGNPRVGHGVEGVVEPLRVARQLFPLPRRGALLQQEVQLCRKLQTAVELVLPVTVGIEEAHKGIALRRLLLIGV